MDIQTTIAIPFPMPDFLETLYSIVPLKENIFLTLILSRHSWFFYLFTTICFILNDCTDWFETFAFMLQLANGSSNHCLIFWKEQKNLLIEMGTLPPTRLLTRILRKMYIQSALLYLWPEHLITLLSLFKMVTYSMLYFLGLLYRIHPFPGCLLVSNRHLAQKRMFSTSTTWTNLNQATGKNQTFQF